MIVDSCFPLNPSDVTRESWTARHYLLGTEPHVIGPPPISDDTLMRTVTQLEGGAVYLIDSWNFSVGRLVLDGADRPEAIFPLPEDQYRAGALWPIRSGALDDYSPPGYTASLRLYDAQGTAMNTAVQFSSLSYGPNPCRVWLANPLTRNATLMLTLSGRTAPGAQLAQVDSAGNVVQGYPVPDGGFNDVWGIYGISLSVYRVRTQSIIDQYFKR